MTHHALKCTLSATCDSEIQVPACPVIAAMLATEGFTVERHYCRMGQDYDCQCTYCSDAAYWLAKQLADQQNAATAEHRTKLLRAAEAFRILATIGQAFRAAGAPGFGYSRMIHDAGAMWDSSIGEQRGSHFRVTGRRGSAKAHVGKVGVCKWIDKDCTPVRIGLAVEGDPGLVYVAFTQLTRIPTPDHEQRERFEQIAVSAAIAPFRPKLAVSLKRNTKRGHGPVAYVVTGRDAGAFGEVFWVGSDKRTGEANARIGIRRPDGSVVWASAYDCAERPMVAIDKDERRLLERIAADAAMEGDARRAQELLAQTRVDQTMEAFQRAGLVRRTCDSVRGGSGK